MDMNQSASPLNAFPQAGPKVAVLMAAFNGMQWLPDQLESILKQDHVSVTVFISVDQSTDGTEAWVDGIADQNDRIRVLPHGKVFGGAAPNFFRLIVEIDFSDFDFVSLADQDDLWLPNKLSRAIEVLKHEQAQAYSSNVVAFWSNGKKAFINKSQTQVRWDFLFEAAGPGCTYVFTQHFARALQSQILAQQSLAKKIGLHDWFIYAFARASQAKWVIDDEALMLYRQHEKNQVGTNKGLKALIHRAQKVTSGWAFEQSRTIAKAVGLQKSSSIRFGLNGSRLGYFWLGCNAWRCRRKTQDQIIFALICFYLTLVGQKQS